MRTARVLFVLIAGLLVLGPSAAGAVLIPPPGSTIGPDDVQPVALDSPVVITDWSMPKRFSTTVSDPQRYGTDLARTRAYVNPSSWSVTITACGSYSRYGTVLSETWRLFDASGRLLMSSSTCSRTVQVPALGNYTLEATVQATDGTRTTRRTITVKDYLVIVAGDSMASGEGNPDVRGSIGIDLCTDNSSELDLAISCIWDMIDILANGLDRAQGGTPSTWKLDRDCHRSYRSGLSLAAKQIEDRDPRSSVTYVNVACSGATVDNLIDEGWDGQYTAGDGGWDTGAKLPQSQHIAKVICGANTCPDAARPIDGLFVSAGVNDLSFASVLQSCVWPDPWPIDDCEDKKRDDVLDAIEDLDGPGGEYEALENELREHRNLNIREIYQATYPTGLFSPNQHGCGLFTFVGSGEVAFLDEMNDRLNNVVPNRVWRDYRTDPWHGHGYCAGSQRWFVTLTEALAYHMGHGSAAHKGTMHPNAAGHAQLQREFVNEWDQRNRPVTDTVDVTFDRVKVTQAQQAFSGRLIFSLARVGTDGIARYGRGAGVGVPDDVDTRDGQWHSLGANSVQVRLGLNRAEQLRVYGHAGFILPPDQVDCPPEYDSPTVQYYRAATDGGGGSGSDQVCLEANTMLIDTERFHGYDTRFGAGQRFEMKDPLGRFTVSYVVSRPACPMCPIAEPAPDITTNA